MLDAYRAVLPQEADENFLARIVMTFYVWLGHVLDLKIRSVLPFVRLQRASYKKSSRMIIRFESTAPFIIEIDHAKLTWTLRVLPDSLLSRQEYLIHWFYEWPWTSWVFHKKESMIELKSDFPALTIFIYVPPATQHLIASRQIAWDQNPNKSKTLFSPALTARKKQEPHTDDAHDEALSHHSEINPHQDNDEDVFVLD